MCVRVQVASARYRRGVIGQRALSRAVSDNESASDTITIQWSTRTCVDSPLWSSKTASVAQYFWLYNDCNRPCRLSDNASRLKMPDWEMADQVAGVENDGLER